jgi:hypothetical protein
VIDALVAAVLLGALSTLGDFVWAALRLHNRVGYGMIHGAAIYAISGIWTNPSPAGPNYLRNFASWTFAFFPGFAALFWTRR